MVLIYLQKQISCQSLIQLSQLIKMQNSSQLLLKSPLRLSFLNKLGQKLIPMDSSYDSLDYKDSSYFQRRLTIGAMSKTHKMNTPIKQVKYTHTEHDTWRRAFQKLHFHQRNVMCQTYRKNMQELQKTLSFSSAIPRMNDLSNYLKTKTGFQLKPVPGMIDQRQFLNCLAFKVFCSGQFIRHPNSIECAPEPDVIHDYIGHIPMFADPAIAALSQKIGLLSIGASDADIKKLGYAYLYTIELGLCLEDNKQKVFGAAIASCVSDLKKIEENKHTWKEFNPQVDCEQEITNFQKPFECFYLSKSLEAASESLLRIAQKNENQYKYSYDSEQEAIIISHSK